MEMAYAGVALVISLVALLVALTATETAWKAADKMRENEGKRNEKTASPAEMTDADIREAKRRRMEHFNFMNYDGTPQPPIDPNEL